MTAAFARHQQAQEWKTTLFVGWISGYTVIPWNTLVVATGKRRRGFALQRLIGSIHGHVLRLLTVESVFVAAAGTALDTTIAALALTALFPIPTWGPAWIFPAVAASALGLTLLSSLIAASVALCGRPVEVASTQIDRELNLQGPHTPAHTHAHRDARPFGVTQRRIHHTGGANPAQHPDRRNAWPARITAPGTSELDRSNC